MPIFNDNGRKYNVKDEHIALFCANHPTATTIAERDGKRYRVKAADYSTFAARGHQPNVADTTTMSADTTAITPTDTTVQMQDTAMTQPSYATTSVADSAAVADTTAMPQAETPLTEAQERNNAVADMRSMYNRVGDIATAHSERIDNMRAYGFGPGYGKARQVGYDVNPETGKLSPSYVTPMGGKTATKGLADNASQQYQLAQAQMLGFQTDEEYAQAQAPADKVVVDLWAEADKRYKTERERNAANSLKPIGMGGRESRIVQGAVRDKDNRVSYMRNFDLVKMADEAWQRVGSQMTESIYKQLQETYPGATYKQLRESATKMARQLSDNAVFNYAVKQNTPKSTLEFFAKKMAGANVLNSITTGLARSEAGTTGDLAAYEYAMGEYGKSHRFADLMGTVTGMAVDPTTWVSAGIGGFFGRITTGLAGRMLYRGVAPSIATRLLGSTMGGRALTAVGAGAGNFATFETVKELESQFAHGGHIDAKTGEIGDYSLGAVFDAAKHGLVMGAATGVAGNVIGNVGDKIVKGTSSTAGKAAGRMGQTAVSAVLEGTIFSVPEWLDGERDAMDVWYDNLYMMAGFKGQHAVKSAPRFIKSLKPIADPKTAAQRNHNRMSYGERLRRQMDMSPKDLYLNKDERAELSRYGYGDLAELMTKEQRWEAEGKPMRLDGEGKVIIDADANESANDNPNKTQESYDKWLKDHPEFDGYDSMVQLMQDKRVSQAARAKAYYLLTGRQLPTGTIVGYAKNVDNDGNIYVMSTTIDGEVVTSRRFSDRSAAYREVDRIMRQAELNSIDAGEQYAEAKANETLMQAGVDAVVPGADYEVFLRNYSAAKSGDKRMQEAYAEEFEAYDKWIEEHQHDADGERPEAIRADIKAETGVDVDKAVRKEYGMRSQAEHDAIQKYIERLFPEQQQQDVSVADVGYYKALTDGSILSQDSGENEGTPSGDGSNMSSDGAGNSSTSQYPTMDKVRAEAYARTNGHTGKIQPIVLNEPAADGSDKGKVVYVLDGNIVLHEDGTIDTSQSDQSIVVYDGATGKRYFVHPKQIESVETTLNPNKEVEAAMTDFYVDGQVSAEEYLTSLGYNPLWMREQTQETLVHEANMQAQKYRPDIAQSQPQSPLQSGQSVTLSDGRTAIVQQPNDSGTGYIVEVDGKVEDIPSEQILPSQTQGNAGQTQQQQTTNTNVAGQTETTTMPQQQTETQGTTTAEAQPQSALSRIPKGEDGKPIYTQADAETSYDAIVEQTNGDEDSANSVVSTMIANKEAKLKAAEKAKGKGETIEDIIAAEQEVQKAKAELAYWQQVAGVREARAKAAQEVATTETTAEVTPTEATTTEPTAEVTPTTAQQETTQETAVPAETKTKTQEVTPTAEVAPTTETTAEVAETTPTTTAETKTPTAEVKQEPTQEAGNTEAAPVVETPKETTTETPKGEDAEVTQGEVEKPTQEGAKEKAPKETTEVEPSEATPKIEMKAGQGAVITATTYTNKRGKTTPMFLVKFKGLTIKQKNAGKELAKESRGWWDSKQGGFMMRSEESAKELVSALGLEEVVQDAQPISVEDIKSMNDNANKAEVTVEPVIDSDITNTTEQAQGLAEAESSETKTNGRAKQKGEKTKIKAKSKWVDDEDAERFEELRKRLRQKLGGQLNMGIDPEAFSIGVEMSFLMLKHGARKFSEYAKNMIEALGEKVRPYLKAFYNGARDLPEMAAFEKDLTPYEEVRSFDVLNFDNKSGAKDVVTTAKHIAREQEVKQEAKEATDKIKAQRNKKNVDSSTGVKTISKEDIIERVKAHPLFELVNNPSTTPSARKSLIHDIMVAVRTALRKEGYVKAWKDLVFDRSFAQNITDMAFGENPIVAEGVKTNKDIFNVGDKVEYSPDGGQTWTDGVVAEPDYEGKIRVDVGYAPSMWVEASPNQLRRKSDTSDEPAKAKPEESTESIADNPQSWKGKTFVSGGVEYECKDVDSGQALFNAKGLYISTSFPTEKVKSWIKSGKWVLKDAEKSPVSVENAKGNSKFATDNPQADKSTEESKRTDVQQKFALSVKDDMLLALEQGRKPYRGIVDLRKRAKQIGISVDDEGRTDILLQELVEDGLVRAAREVAERYKGSDSKDVYDLICKLYDMQPTISMRSSNRIKMQQYSTPLPMAWNAARFAMKGKDGGLVLEPTAGNGMLVFAVPAGQVHANELDDTRLANLREQGFVKVTNQDATLPFEEGRKYDVVIANPPFGSAPAKNYDGKKIGGLDPQITLNVLNAMKDDGRAAIIIGGNMEYAENGAIKNMKAFFTYLYDHYNVKGVVDMDGKLYAKQGTTFPTRMILIEGRRSESERAQTAVYPPVQSKAVRRAETFEDLYNIVEEITNSKNKTNGTEVLRSQQGQLVSVGNESSGTADGLGHNRQPSTNDGNRRGGGDGRRRGTNVGAEEKTPRHGDTVLLGESGTDIGNGEDGGGTSGNRPRNSGRVSEPGVRRVDGVGVSTVGMGLTPNQEEKNSKQQKTENRTLTSEKLSYRPHSNSFFLESVSPSAMVESMDKTLSRIEAQYGSIDEFVTNELGYDSVEEAHKALAAEQMDGVAMAIYQMKRGQALIIGDQTGLGKGRQMAALIRWAVKQGKKPIFFTKSADLFSDILRDLVDIGSGDLVPFIFNSDGAMVDGNGKTIHKPLPKNKMAEVFESGELPDGFDYAVLTYTQVNTGDETSRGEANEAAKKNGGRAKKSKSAGKATPKATFLRAIARDNYLLLDESHSASGASNTGFYLQSILRGAKAATFASATFAKRPDSMPLYALRTAMSQAKVESDKMIGIIAKGGVTLQEIMSRELANAGQMVRRERDMSDVQTDWKTIDDPETVKRARDSYDRTIAAFNAIIEFQEKYVKPMVRRMSEDLAITAGSAGLKQGTEKMGIENVPFANKTYNYTKQLMLALKVDAIVNEVEKEINAGRHPVIALENTMEGLINGYAVDSVVEEPTFGASLLKGLDNAMQYTINDENGGKIQERYSPEQLGEAGEKAYYDLVRFIKENTSDIYISPIDAIIDRLHEKGYKVGELTGRNTYVERDENGKVVVRRRTDKDKKRMQREFNNGNLDVLILNKTASTGISLHASKVFKDQRQRTMIIAQPLSDINDYMQMIGRIDRTGQVHRGYYINLGLPVPAESRFLMMLSTKLKSLNANTTTSQDSKSNDMAAPDILNKYGSQVVIEYLRDNPDVYEKMGEPLKEGKNNLSAEDLDTYKPQEDDARKITGYVALLSTKEQEDFYNDVVGRYNELIKYLNDTGSNDLKITVMPLRAQTLDKRVSSRGVDPNGENPFAKDSYVETVEMDVLRKPMKAEEVKQTISQVCKGMEPKAYTNHVIETLRNEALAKLKDEDARYERAKQNAEKDITKQTEKINASQKLSEEEKVDAIAKYTANKESDVEDTHERRVNIIKTKANNIYRRLLSFEIGKSYLVPDILEVDVFDSASPAIFCGYKTKESNITTSTTLAVFAVLDGRRRIEIKLSQDSVIDRITKTTLDNIDSARRTTLDNWDDQRPTGARKKGHILTGNILQAIADSQDDGGNFRGQLISYTDMEGGIHDGILMPDKWNVSMLKSSGIPLISRLEQIKNFEPVVSKDGKIEILGSSFSRMYYLTVPKTKKDGAVFFDNRVILKNTRSNVFYPYHGKLRADIPADNIGAVVKELTKLGVMVEDNAEMLREHKAEGVEPLTEEEKVLRDALAEKMKSAGLDVLADEEAQKVLEKAKKNEELSKGIRFALDAINEESEEPPTANGNNPSRPSIEDSSDSEANVDNRIELSSDYKEELAKLSERVENGEEIKPEDFLLEIEGALGSHNENPDITQYFKGQEDTTLRVANHRGSATMFLLHDHVTGNTSVVVKMNERKFRKNDAVDLKEFVYFPDKMNAEVQQTIIKGLLEWSETGEYNQPCDQINISTRKNGIRMMKVFHGSGADFDAFDHSFMGTGEGAQVYGWGTYVTEVEGIGRVYAEAYGDAPRTGEQAELRLRFNKARENLNSLRRMRRKIKSYEGFIEYIQKDIESTEDEAKRYDAVFRKDTASALWRHVEKLKSKLNKAGYDEVLEVLHGKIAEAKLVADEAKKEYDKVRPVSTLYTVEIPEDNGRNYMDWTEPLTDEQVAMWKKALLNSTPKADRGEVEEWADNLIAKRKAEGEPFDGQQAYYAIDGAYSSKKSSKALSGAGFTGIKYPANYKRGGNNDGAKNYVIFKDSDAKITDKLRFFRTSDGEIYGFAVDGKIGYDSRIAGSETLIHEYSHLWAEALRKMNPKEWSNVVELMKGTGIWDSVKKAYPELKTDDEIAEEVLSHYSGKRGAERLRAEQKRIAESNGSIMEKANAISAIERVREALERFWKGVCDFLHIHYTSAEEVADRVMRDLLEGVDPRKYMEGKPLDKRVRKQFVGEKGAENADHAEEVTTRLDNLAVAREMEAAKKDAKAIKMATGWERGADGKWRYEIADIEFVPEGNADLNHRVESQPWGKEYVALTDRMIDGETLSEAEMKRFEELSKKAEEVRNVYESLDKKYLMDYVRADDLFKSYPKMKAVEVVFADAKGAWDGKYSEEENTIYINENGTTPYDDVLVHEIQHAIQRIEGFAKGGNARSVRGLIKEIIDDNSEQAERFVTTATTVLKLNSLIYRLDNEYRKLINSNEEWERDIAVDDYFDALNTISNGTYDDGNGSLYSDFEPFNKKKMSPYEIAKTGYHVDETVKELRRLADVWKGRIDFEDGKVKDMVWKLENALNTKTDNELYRSLAGEVESRNVQKRMGMTPEERRASLAAETEDVAREDQIFLFGEDWESYMGTRTNRKASDSGVSYTQLSAHANLSDASSTANVSNNSGTTSEGGELFRTVYGGNSGYVGYSMSRRAARARGEGRFPKTDFCKTYSVTPKSFDTLVSLGIIDNSEWHHTSMYGNRTTFYGWDEEYERFADIYRDNKAEIDKLSIAASKGSKEAEERILDLFEAEKERVWALRKREIDDAKERHKREQEEFSARVEAMKEVASIHPEITPTQVGNDSGYRIDLDGVQILFGKTLDDERGRQYAEGVDKGAVKIAVRQYLDNLRAEVENKKNESKKDDLYREGEGSASSPEGIESAVNEMAGGLNAKVRIIRDVNEITDENAERQAKKRSAKGWYDPKTGEVVIVLPNAESIADAQATILHEVVGHKGLRGLLGEKFDDMMDTIYKSLPDSVREAINKAAMSKHKGNFRTAVEEYLSSIAENGVSEPKTWSKIKSAIRSFFRSIGINVEMRDEDIAYMLWKSKNRLEKGDSVIERAHKIAADEEMKEGLLFRDPLVREGTLLNIPNKHRRAMRELIEVVTGGLRGASAYTRELYTRFREGYQDQMIRLRDFQRAIEKELGRKVKDFEDAYTYFTTMQGRAEYDLNHYKATEYKALLDEVARFSRGAKGFNAKKRREVELYMMAKHGLERNEAMRKKALAKLKNPTAEEVEAINNKDYSGLTAITKELFGAEGMNEDAIRDFVEGFESRHNTERLWKCVKAATQATLQKMYESNLISKEQMDKLSEQYKHYIPLKAWDETTAGDIWDYVDGDRDVVSNPIKHAKGRTSMAGSVLANIINDYESAVMMGYKNLFKLRFANLVRNSDTKMASVSSQWYVESGIDEDGNITWEPVSATGLTEDAAKNADIINDFEKRMKELEKEGKAKTHKEVLNLGLPIKAWQEQQHVVRLKEGGKDLLIYINGNPAVSQAINGENRAKLDNTVLKWLNNVRKFMMQNYTSRSINFILRNLVRDFFYANTMNFVKYGAGFEGWFIKNYPAAYKRIAMAEWGGKHDADYEAFLRGGGRTGYASVFGYEKYKQEIERLINKSAGGKLRVKDVFHIIGNNLEMANGVIENVSRFAAYLAAKESGMSELKAIEAAKEVSVNFNRRGSGTMGAVYMQNFYHFFNAAIQGLHNFAHAAKEHPVRTAAAIAAWTTLGYAWSAIGGWIKGLLGGDDDDEKEGYTNLPDFIRQNNLVFNMWWTKDEKYALLPLSPELRLYFAIGDMMAQYQRGEYKGRDFSADLVAKMMELMPISIEAKDTDNPVKAAVKTFTPDMIAPITDAYFFNENWLGKRVTGRNEYNTYVPEYHKVTTGTSKALIKASEELNKMSGGDYATKGALDYAMLNPSAIEYIFEQYLGGVGKLIGQVYKTTEGVVNDDVQLRNIPVVSGLTYDKTNSIPRNYTTERYDNYIKEFEAARSRDKMYNKGLRGGEDLIDNYTEFASSEEYQKYQIIKTYKKAIDNLYDMSKDLDGDLKKQVLKQAKDMKQLMIDELDKIDNEE